MGQRQQYIFVHVLEPERVYPPLHPTLEYTQTSNRFQSVYCMNIQKASQNSLYNSQSPQVSLLYWTEQEDFRCRS